MSDSIPNPEFNRYADEYDSVLERGLSVSGENKDYFAQGRLAWLYSVLKQYGENPLNVIDFGCGTGSATPYFFDELGVEQVTGVDVSDKSLSVARRLYTEKSARFDTLNKYQPQNEYDLAFCNGVFHHIPVDERRAATDYIYRALRPNGWFAFFENNPWNPGTRYIMSRVEFDRDAIMLSPPSARRLLSTSGFKIVRTDFLFIFPRALRLLRPLESRLARFPLGGQYMILCRKP